MPNHSYLYELLYSYIGKMSYTERNFIHLDQLCDIGAFHYADFYTILLGSENPWSSSLAPSAGA